MSDPFNLNGQAVAADLVRVMAERDQYRSWWEASERRRAEVELVLDRVLGTEEDDGAGEGLVADVELALVRVVEQERERIAQAIEALAPFGKPKDYRFGYAVARKMAARIARTQDPS